MLCRVFAAPCVDGNAAAGCLEAPAAVGPWVMAELAGHSTWLKYPADAWELAKATLGQELGM